ncbi:MAG: DUF167 domain-containing protein [Elusimicrobiaceae bacterium]|jgi:hypothetical protein
MYIKLRVHAGCKRAEIRKKAEDAYEVWVKAPAERGLANEETINSLASALGVPAKRIRLIKGGQSPSKIVEIIGGN